MSTEYTTLLSVLLTELIYFLFCSIVYIYMSPRYRVFWAALYCTKPSNIKINNRNIINNKKRKKRQNAQSHSTSNQTSNQTSTSNVTSNELSSINAIRSTHHQSVEIEVNHDQSRGFKFTAQHIATKKKAFIYYGMETITHCFLLLIFLIFTIIYMAIRMKMEFIVDNNEWSKYSTFCQYAVRLRVLFISIPHYFFLLFLCIPALRVELMITTSTKSSKCTRQRLIPTVSIIYIIICCIVHTYFQLSITYHVSDGNCLKTGKGFGVIEGVIIYNSIQYAICIILSFLTFIVPLFEQRKMLKNLPNIDHENNKPVLLLIKKINNISKRVCISGGIGCAAVLVINASFYIDQEDYELLSILFMTYFVIWVNLYFVMIFIYNDWRIRLCAIFYYFYINYNCCTCFGNTKIEFINGNDIELQTADGRDDDDVDSLPVLNKSITTADISSI